MELNKANERNEVNDDFFIFSHLHLYFMVLELIYSNLYKGPRSNIAYVKPTY